MSIYIENQFFSSLNDTKVESEIQDALVDRITRAHEENANDFYVMIILSLKPEFEEETNCSWNPCDPYDRTTDLIHASLFKDENSLFGKLKQRKVPVENYTGVFGLRNYDWLNEELVTELIYVHSKLMKVDDRLTIIGSANINDRSMLGYRDTEVDVVITDQEMINGTMNGKPYEVGVFSHSLRCQLMNEHLGQLKGNQSDKNAIVDVSDPVAVPYRDKISSISSKNSEIYELVFPNENHVLPTKQTGYLIREPETLFSEMVNETLSEIKGHIVKFSGSETECMYTCCLIWRLV